MAQPRSDQVGKALSSGGIMSSIARSDPVKGRGKTHVRRHHRHAGARHVRPPSPKPEWGLGQVQSNIDSKVTVNFENEGKVVVDGRRIALIMEFLS
jgi:hypothetical protein